MAVIKHHIETEEKRQWLRKLGWAGIIFFTVKGLLWLGAFALLFLFGIEL